MNRFIAILYALYVAFYVTGCIATGSGTVNVYSPQGEATVDKTVSTNAEIELIP